MTGMPERLSLATLAALCDILDCRPGDLIEPVADNRRQPGLRPRGSGQRPRPVRARVRRRPRVAAVAARCPAGHELPGRRAAALPGLPPGAGHRRQ